MLRTIAWIFGIRNGAGHILVTTRPNLAAKLAAAAAQTMRSAKWVVRYDIPEGHGIRYKQSPPPGHYHIWIGGDYEELHGYLALDCSCEIQR